MVVWESRLEIGVPEIDAQHRELFARVAGFDDALASGDRPAIARTFAFLREYALVHFETEERLMAATLFPGREAHRVLHRGFVERLRALSEDYAANGAHALLRLRARNWVVVWLVDHVGREDVALGRHVHASAA
jgi:hemerythrin